MLIVKKSIHYSKSPAPPPPKKTSDLHESHKGSCQKIGCTVHLSLPLWPRACGERVEHETVGGLGAGPPVGSGEKLVVGSQHPPEADDLVVI
jgi:hypothetical protein